MSPITLLFSLFLVFVQGLESGFPLGDASLKAQHEGLVNDMKGLLVDKMKDFQSDVDGHVKNLKSVLETSPKEGEQRIHNMYEKSVQKLRQVNAPQCNGDTLGSSDMEASFKNILQHKVDRLLEIKKEVETILKEAESHAERNSNKLEADGAPQACLKLLRATDAPCPDVVALIAQLRLVVVDVSQLIMDGIETFNKTFSSSSYQCMSTYNPFSAFRCFLRAFRAAYDNLSSLTAEVGKARDEAEKFYTEYLRYSKQCKDEAQNKVELFSLCKKIHSVN